MKKVSVVIPAYNKSEYTKITVESVLSQTYENIEIIVVDDGSTDDTNERMKQFGDKINYIYKKNAGASSARNEGMRVATGEYVAHIDCDDVYYPEKIEKSVKCLEKNSEYGFVYTDVYKIDEYNNIVGDFSDFALKATSGWIASKLVLENWMNNSTLVARKCCFEKVGVFDENIFVPADWDMVIRLAAVYKAAYLPEKLTGYRISEQSTLSYLNDVVDEYIYVIKKSVRSGLITSKKIENRCYANAYYLHAKHFASINDVKSARNLFFKAAITDIFHPKTNKILLGLFLSYFFPNKLYSYFLRNFRHLPSILT